MAIWPVDDDTNAAPEDTGGPEYWDAEEARQERLRTMADMQIDEGDSDEWEDDYP